MRILILGGTGVMGRPLVELLSSEYQKYDIYVTSRKKRVSKKLNIHYLQGDAHDQVFLSSVLEEKFDAIIDFMHYRTDELENHVDKLLDSTEQYLFFSSSRVYAHSEYSLIEESPRLLDVCQDKEYLNTDDYALTKAREEDILYNSEKKNWTIIRPYITYNDERLQLGLLEKEIWVYRLINNRTIILGADMAKQKTTLTYGSDVAKVIVKLIGKKEALGETIHITSGQSVTWEEVLNIYTTLLEQKFYITPKVKYIKDSSELKSVFPSQRYQLTYDRLFNREFDNSKIFNICGEKIDFTDLQKGLCICLNNIINNNVFVEINPNAQAYMDRKTKEVTPLHEFSGIGAKIKYILARYVPIPVIAYLNIYNIISKIKNKT